MSPSIRLALAVSLVAVVLIPVAAVASNRFTDVPDSNIFHDDISALADSGVTKGCNPPANDEYCPSDFVTRGQMAAFMNRLGALAPGKTPVVNADKLDGLDSTDFMTVLAHSYGSFLDGTALNLGPANDTQIADSVEITVPAAGVLLIHNTSSWDQTGTDYVVHSWVEVDSTPGCNPDYFGSGDPISGSFAADAEDSSAGRANTAAVSTVAVSGGGTYTVLHCLQNFFGTGITGLDHALSVQWFSAAFSSYTTAQASPSSPATPPAGSTSSGG